jgi:CRP/FNR family transcriptional regulator, cyclic AMP receptor protein
MTSIYPGNSLYLLVNREFMSEHLEKYFIFAEDRQTYGPADSTLLQQWAREGLISDASWVFHEASDTWMRAGGLPFLKSLLAGHTSLEKASTANLGLRPGQLRRIRLLADMTDQQAEKFVNLVEKVKVRPFAPIVKQGENGDSMFLILDGEARVSTHINGKDDTIAMLGVGDFFGELALLDNGPRSADVTANKECTLLKLSKENFENILSKDAELASLFLIAMNRFLGSRLRATTERFSNAQNFARGVGGQVTAPSSMGWKKGF